MTSQDVPFSPRRRTIVKAAAATSLFSTVIQGSPSFAEEAPAFLHGVASGDPLPDGVLLWTRITPTAAASAGSGIGPEVNVAWEISRNAAFQPVAATGVVKATPAADHTVKVDVRGLQHSTTYFYRFVVGAVQSPVGQTRTAPLYESSTPLRFGVVSCANWEAGYFSAYRHIAACNDLDAVVHLGDYIYEYASGVYPETADVVRKHAPVHEITTLADYRARHAKYKTDPDLQALHRAHAVVAIWDDHEFADDAWSGGAIDHTPEEAGDWAARVSAAKQAYFEWMPVRPSIAGTVYRKLRFGKLADLNLLDLRSFRSQQASTGSGTVDQPGRTITGRAQLDWLKSSLSDSKALWKFVGTSVMISPVAFGSLPARLLSPIVEMLGLPKDGLAVNTDQWDGYTSDRRELLAHISGQGVSNTVFLTGDIHMAWANDVPLDAATYPVSPSVATEFVVTSVTADNLDDTLHVPAHSVSLLANAAIRSSNSHVKWLDMDSHGYAILDVTEAHAQMDYYAISDKTRRDASAELVASHRTLAGTHAVAQVEAPAAR
ncbi:alkaline phosphatase D family protein [Streptomyces sp. NPDC008121]|uniref:alkaline phosphatase D family protein n=1 Tax=Streptomyces sp. NPDC008121 TaxID=3364809 RepID=UPI0036EC80E2